MSADEELTLTRAAYLAGLSPQRLRQLISEGRLPARKVGRDWLVHPADALELARDSSRRTGRPGSLLEGNWVLRDLDVNRQSWLVHATAAVMAQPTAHGFLLTFVPLAAGDEGFEVPVTGRGSDAAKSWRWVEVAIDHWAAIVERVRGLRVNREVLDSPPTEVTEIAEVDPDFPRDWAVDDLRAATPLDLTEVQEWLRTDRRRLVVWATQALAKRLGGRVFRYLDGEDIDAVIQVRTPEAKGMAVRVGFNSLVAAREAAARRRCDLAYVITIGDPHAHLHEDGARMRVRFERLERLMMAFPHPGATA